MSLFDKMKKLNSGEEEMNEGLENKETSEAQELEKDVQPKKRVRRAKKVKTEADKSLPIEMKSKDETFSSTNLSLDEKKWPEVEGQLAVDVYQTDDELIIQTAIAGVKPEDLDITTQGDTITIRGQRERTEKKEGENYFYQECYWGVFSRQIILPVEADSARSQASMTDGILTIRIPKIVKEGTKKISVK